MTYSKSLLSKEDSTWIKGFLTLFIILGHNMLFTIPLKDYGMMSYFYLFHIQGFFLLPFLYGVNDNVSMNTRIKDVVVRFYYPYVVFATSMMLVWGGRDHFANFTFDGLLDLYLFCDSVSIKQMCGIQILWFLPSMMILVILKELYYRKDWLVRSSLILISVCMIGVDVYANTSYKAYMIKTEIVRHIPFGAEYAIRMLVMGVLFRLIVEYIRRKQNYRFAFVLSVIGFLICSFLYLKYVAFYIGQSNLSVIYSMLQHIAPILFLVMILCMLRFIRLYKGQSMISKIGNRSLYVYLISPFIGYGFYFVGIGLDLIVWWIGLLSWPIIIMISYWISLLIKGRIENILFPRSLKVLSYITKQVV